MRFIRCPTPHHCSPEGYQQRQTAAAAPSSPAAAAEVGEHQVPHAIRGCRRLMQRSAIGGEEGG